MLMAEVLQFWHISCRFDIENMAWALTWELLKLCKLSIIYAAKASFSAWGFTFNNFFSTYISSIHAYLYLIRVSNIYIYLKHEYIWSPGSTTDVMWVNTKLHSATSEPTQSSSRGVSSFTDSSALLNNWVVNFTKMKSF